MDDTGMPALPRIEGEICVTGPTVMSGYLNDPETNAEVLRDGWYRTGDSGYFDESGFLFVTGRIREAVNRGGEKFSLAGIDEALTSLEGVSMAAAFSAPHPDLGQEVYAAVVLEPQSGWNANSLRGELSRRLSWARVPKRVFIVDELPMNATGKVLRQSLAKLLINQGTPPGL
jgi:acyl-CoA synthetase (AMP-forming)/AMP-acid ligase II